MTIIPDTREYTLGTELEAEFIDGDGSELDTDNIPRGWDVVSDGSLNNGIECVSARMSGNTVIYGRLNEITGFMKHANLESHDTAGMHVHIGTKKEVNNELLRRYFLTYFAFYPLMIATQPQHRLQNRYCMPYGRVFYHLARRGRINELDRYLYLGYSNFNTTKKLIAEYKKQIKRAEDRHALRPRKIDQLPCDLVTVLFFDENMREVKKKLYCPFECSGIGQNIDYDLLHQFARLKESIRCSSQKYEEFEKQYNEAISGVPVIAAESIERLRTMEREELQNIERKLSHMKRDRYVRPKYYAINLHSLFYRGTVEYRFFHSTVERDVAMFNVNLVCAFQEYVERGFSDDEIKGVLNTQSFMERLALFLNLLKYQKDMRQEIHRRIMKNKNTTVAGVRDLMQLLH